MDMKYISLFSGIEAASVAWRPLGWDPIAFCEFDKTPSKVLAKNFPNIPNLGDVTKVDWNKYHGTAKIVVGGSPCQAFSIAGARKGLNDLRGQLMLEYLRACAEIDPEWIIWENVPGVLSSNGGRDFATLLNSVSKLWGARGGGGAWRVLDAQYFGVPQRRKRIFFVVNTHDWRRAVNVLYDSASLQGDTCKAGQKAEALRASRLEGRLSGSNKVQCRIDTQSSAPTMSDACPTLLRHNRNDPPYVWGGGYPFRRLTAEECEALQGFPPGWTDCLRYRERIGVLGNSMAVSVMRWLGRRIEITSKGAK